MSDDVIPAGLPDWCTTRKCVPAHRAPAQGQPDGGLHRPHQTLWLQLRHQGTGLHWWCVIDRSPSWPGHTLNQRHPSLVWSKHNYINFISKHNITCFVQTGNYGPSIHSQASRAFLVILVPSKHRQHHLFQQMLIIRSSIQNSVWGRVHLCVLPHTAIISDQVWLQQENRKWPFP